MYVQNIKLTQVTLVHFFWPLFGLEACLEPGYLTFELYRNVCVDPYPSRVVSFSMAGTIP